MVSFEHKINPPVYNKLSPFSQNKSQKIVSTIFFFCVYVAILVYKNFFRESFYQDEIHFFETSIRFGKQIIPSLDLLKNYAELNTPLPFMIGGWWTNVFGQNIQTLRILTFSLSFLIINLFIWQSKTSTTQMWLGLFGLWLFPNYYLCTVYFYTDIFAMTAMLLGMTAYLNQRHFWAGLLFIAAISCRQYMVAFPAAIVAHEGWGVLIKTNSISLVISKLTNKKYLVWYVLSCLSLLPWLVLWGGFAPAVEMARQHYDKISAYKPGFVLYVSAVTSVYFVIPEAIFSRKFQYYLSYPRQNLYLFLGLLVLTLALIVLFPAQQTKNAYFDWPYLGYVDQGLMTIGIKGVAKQLVFGFLMLISLMRFVRLDANLTTWIFIINTLLLGKAQLSWDKYSLPTVLCLWFLMVFEQKDERLIKPKK